MGDSRIVDCAMCGTETGSGSLCESCGDDENYNNDCEQGENVMPKNAMQIGVEQALTEYGVTDAALASLAGKYDISSISGPAGYKIAVAGIAETRDLRGRVEKKRKELKADALEFGRKVDGEAKRITGALVAIEDPLKELKAEVDEEKARVKAEKERVAREAAEAEQKRVARIKEMIAMNFGNLNNLKLRGKTSDEMCGLVMTMKEIEVDEEYQEFVAEAIAIRQATGAQAQEIIDAQITAEAEAERQRIEAVALAEVRASFERQQAAHQLILDEAEAKRKEQQAAIDLANKAAADKLAEERRLFDEEKARTAAAERVRLDTIAAAAKAETDRLEREEFEAQAKAKAEREAAEKVSREAAELAQKAEAVKVEAGRQAALAPDREKLQIFAAEIMGLTIHNPLTSEEATDVLAWAEAALEDVAQAVATRAAQL